MKLFSDRRWLAGAIVVWTLVAWGGRITLIAVGDDWFDILRIAGSFLVGLAVGAVLWLSERPPGWALNGFAVWTVLIWTRSMWVNWTESGTLGFKLIHTLLAVGFFVLAYAAWTFARSDLVAGPDEGHRDQQGDSETATVS